MREALAAGTRFGQWAIRKRIGRGAFGHVYSAAAPPHRSADYAIKVEPADARVCAREPTPPAACKQQPPIAGCAWQAAAFLGGRRVPSARRRLRLRHHALVW